MQQITDSSSFEFQVSVASDRAATVTLVSSPKESFSRLTLRNILSNIDSNNVHQILIGIAAGMKHLHDHACAHMDLTDSNIIIGQNGNISIINFKKSRNFANGEHKATERQQENSSDSKTDIFCFGLLLDEIFSKKPSNETSRRSEYTRVPSYIPHSYASLYLRCLNKSPSQRPTFTKILDELQGMDLNSNLSLKPLLEKSVYRPPKNDFDLSKFKGVIPAFYACYDDNGQVDHDRTVALARYLFGINGIVGLYVGGSSGEGIYQTVEEKKKVLEWVVEANANFNKTIIAHVGCNNTKDSQELARHAQENHVDAIASIPPIYFHLPEYSIADYWTSISKAAPATPFIIYNIPQLAGVNLTKSLLRTMFDNCPNTLIGVKNSSVPTQDIQMWREVAMERYGDQVDDKFIVFNGPDEQLVSGLIIGANGCIGGTYASMPKLFVKAYECVLSSSTDNTTAMNIQNDICRIIYKYLEAHGNLYSVMKEVIKIQCGLDCGDVRAPLVRHTEEDMEIIRQAKEMIDDAEKKYGLK